MTNSRNTFFCLHAQYSDEDIFARSYTPGSLTKHKFNTLGTHEAVKESRRTYQTNQQQKQGRLFRRTKVFRFYTFVVTL